MADITSTSNHRIKLARKLQRKRHRDQTGLCVLEGWRLVQDAWAAGAAFDAIFVAEVEPADAESAPDPSFLAELSQRSVPILTTSREVMTAITETVTPQKIVGIVRIPGPTLPINPGLILVMDQVRDPGNAGTLLRSAAAAGTDLVLFGPETVDPYNDKVLRAGMGAHFRLPLRVCEDWDEIKSILGERAVYVADAGAETAYDRVDWQQSSALIIGGEASGPGDEARRMATPVAIPMHGTTESLNAAVAGSIILFEAARQRRKSLH
jgi:RNA methyltransferase, TrmH family